MEAASSRLAQEAFAEGLVLGQAGGHQLQRDFALEAAILGAVDHAHAAVAEQGLDPVAGELRSDSRVLAHVHVRILAFAPRNDTATDEVIARRCYRCI